MKYDSSSIQTLRGLEAVRKNPGMYIGGTDEYGLFTVLRELLDNSADEYLAGRNSSVGVTINEDGSFIVEDSGSGIPQGIKVYDLEVNGKIVKQKMPTMQAVFGELHTSGKFQSDAYKVSIGSHGVGVKSTNATADLFNVKTCYKNKWYEIEFRKGVLKKKVTECSAPKSAISGKKMTNGTLVHFAPDKSIFTVKKFPTAMLTEWAEVMSYLSPEFKISIQLSNGKQKTYFSKLGPRDYIKSRIEKFKAEAEEKIFEFNDELATVAVAFSNVDGMELRGFTNGLSNGQGGKHVDSVSNGIFQALKEFAGKKEFSVHDFRDGLLGLVNAKLHKAQFASQDKAKLTDPRMGAEFQAKIEKQAKKFFAENKAMATRLCERAERIAELKNKFKASKAVSTELNKLKKGGMSHLFAPAHNSVRPQDRELLLVEGESAGGGLRKVKAKHQAMLPLTGKILNVHKAKGDKAMISKNIIAILAAIGFDPKQKDPLSKLQVGRIICLADADPDGRHINCLLLTLFAKYLPDMFSRGMIYVADMPEFYAISKGMLYKGDTLSEVQKKLKGVKAEIKHIKGWGEIDPPVMKILAVDDESRKLIKINPITVEERQKFFALMGKEEEIK